jgi:hypothetical protein
MPCKLLLYNHIKILKFINHLLTGQCRSKKVAVKKLIKQNLDEKELQDFRREIEILS